MVQEHNEFDEFKGKQESELDLSESDRLFNEMATVEPRRNVELADEGDAEDRIVDDGGDTLDDRIKYSPKLTDMQVADKRLNPDLGFDHLNIIQMGRTFPDVYNPLFRILTKSLIRSSLTKEADNGKGKNKKITVAEAIAKVNTALSISIDGEGRLDEIHILGSSVRDNEEKSKNNLGM